MFERSKPAAWLVDHLRTTPPKASGERFTVLISINKPREYLRGPMTLSNAQRAKKYLGRCWGNNCE